MSQFIRFKTIFVALADVDGKSLTQFYTQLFNCEPTVYIPQIYSEFQLPGLRLGIFKPKTSHQEEFAGVSRGNMSLCLEVEDLQAAIAHLTALGYPPSGEVMHTSHGREIYAYDPVGNRLILHQTEG